jgi:hypothetical protein
LVAIEIGFEQNAVDCKTPEEEEETEGQLGKVGTDVDILTTPVLQRCFDSAREGLQLDYL